MGFNLLLAGFSFSNSTVILFSLKVKLPKMASDLVSVVVPAYNAGLYLKQTLESALGQTYKVVEIIVVDDGSTDDTSIISRQFGDAIQYIYQPNRGLSAARNTAIRHARAEFIALLDSDDLWEPEFLQRMIPLLKLHPKAAGAYCGFQYINSKSEIVGKPSVKIVPPEQFHSAMKYNGNWLAPCSVIFRRQLADEAGLFDESLHAVEDWDLWIRLSEKHPFVGLPEALVRYRRHENNMSKDPERMINAIYQLTAKLYGTTESNLSTWSPSKRNAYCNHYRGGAITFFASGRMEKSMDYLEKLIEISPEFACSLLVWRGFARSLIPDEYQFDVKYLPDWDLIRGKFDELFRLLAQRANLSNNLRDLLPKLKSFAFLALADEAGRSGKLGWAYDWLNLAVRSYCRLIFVRPFWGTIVRSMVALVSLPSRIRRFRAAHP